MFIFLLITKILSICANDQLENCDVCEAAESESCTTCKSTHVLGTDGKCTQTCAEASSDSNCATCSKTGDEINCLTCVDGTQPTQGKCTTTQNACETFDPNCQECDDADSPTACTTCKSTHVLGTGGKCTQTCAEASSDSNCATCSKTGDEINCLTCVDGTQPTQGKCTNTKPPSSTCTAYATNCAECDSTGNVCLKCMDAYGLRGGQCSLCDTGKFVSVTEPCKADCIIENCSKCTIENNIAYCDICITGYHTSEGKKSCIKDVPGKCADDVWGCLECSYEGSNICTKCDESKNLELKEGNYCDCIDNTYEEYIDGCIKKSDISEECKTSNCVQCTGDPEKCLKCEDGYGLSNEKCTKCEDGLAAGGSLPCLTSCNGQYGCEECKGLSSTQYICTSCLDGYKLDEESYNCVQILNETSVDCSPTVTGCLKCYQYDTSKCKVCDSENHFLLSSVSKGTCYCDPKYDFVNNQCIEPPKPVVAETIVADSNPQLEEGAVKFDEVKETYGIDLSKTKLKEGFDANEFVIPNEAKSISVTNQGPLSVLKVPSTSNTYSFTAIDSSVILDCPNNANIDLPEKSENADIKGSGTLNINNDKDSGEINIGKVTIEPSANPLSAIATKSTLNLNVLDIFGQQELSGPSKESLKCKLAKIEGGGSFKPKKMSIDSVKVGLNSLLEIGSTDDVEIKDFLVAYNTTYTNIPIKFNGKFENLPDMTIALFNQEQNKLIQDDSELEAVVLSQFEGKNAADCLKQCNDKMKFSPSAGFNSAECRVVGENKCNKVAMKTATKKGDDDDDGGLSGGAIAGIVIACVVVVAAIIALLVYFLVIKKKNQSTTSTQGDSSIAI